VLATAARGPWYADAARMALDRDNVWFDLAGLPPKRLPDYYAGFDLAALARKWIFGTDWPGVPAWPTTCAPWPRSASPATPWPATPPTSTRASPRPSRSVGAPHGAC
jgi:Amidohydrolase